MAPWYLYKFQRAIHEHLGKHRFPVVESTRRGGKTTTDLVFVIEYLVKNPAHVWRWCEPWKYQAREIVMPEMDKIQAEVEQKVRFKFYKTDSFYANAMDSKLYLRGVNEDRGESARGAFAHGITADELGSWKDPEYILNEVLMPQLLTTNGPLHKLSTPPKDLGHFWYSEKAKAINEKRFMQVTIGDVVYVTEAQRIEMCETVGGPNSPAWRREFLCEPVADPESLVIPEFTDNHISIPEKPKFYDAYVGCDLGFNDYTALLFSYYDFLTATLVIEDELVLHGKNSKEIVERAKGIEEGLWGKQRPYLRVSDNDVQQLHDMATLCDYQLVPTRKDDKEAAINSLRLRFRQDKIKINPRCQNLIFQLRVGMWNETKKNYLRGAKIGHLDAIDALVYLNRNINTTKNPYPAADTPSTTHFINPEFQKPFDEESEKLKNIMPFANLRVF